MANDTEFGLAAYFYTRDLARSWRVSEAHRIRHRRAQHRHHFHRGRAFRRSQGIRNRPRRIEVRNPRLHRNEICVRRRSELAEPVCSGGSSIFARHAGYPGVAWSFTSGSDSRRREVGEAWPHPYAVVTDGRICIGLHQEFTAPSPHLCQAGLASASGCSRKTWVAFRVSPSRQRCVQRARLARPFGSSDTAGRGPHFQPEQTLHATDTSLCGYFLEIALPAAKRDAAKEFWEKFGFVGMEEPDAVLPHVSCTSDSVDIGLYEPAHVLTAHAAIRCRRRRRYALRGWPKRDIADRSSTATAAAASCRVLTAPEGTPILLCRSCGLPLRALAHHPRPRQI